MLTGDLLFTRVRACGDGGAAMWLGPVELRAPKEVTTAGGSRNSPETAILSGPSLILCGVLDIHRTTSYAHITKGMNT
jgi:hypothetical protein